MPYHPGGIIYICHSCLTCSILLYVKTLTEFLARSTRNLLVPQSVCYSTEIASHALLIWYIGHSPSQYVDGLRGPLIVDDPHSPYAAKYDAELVMTVSDWYHGNVNLRNLRLEC